MNTIKVQIKTILLENCKYDIDLYNALTKELQNDTIVSYVLSPSKIFAYVQTTDDFGITIESNDVFHHIDDIYNKFLVDFPNVLLETLKYDDIAVEIIHSDEDEPDVSEIDLESMQRVYDTLQAVYDDNVIVPYTEEEMTEINSNIEKSQQIQQAIKDEYLENGKRVVLANLSFVNGYAMIFDEDNNIIILQDDFELEYNPESYNSDDGTVQIIRTEKPNRALLPVDDSATDEEVLELFQNQKQSDGVKNDMKNNIQAFDAIENDLPYSISEVLEKPMNSYEKNVNEMKKVIQGMRDACETLTISESLHSTKKVILENDTSITINDSDVDDEELAAYSIGDTIQETVALKVALISSSSFDEYAQTHNIVGWDLLTPTTLLIKYMEDGKTSEEKIKKFHDMMNSLNTGLVQSTTNGAKFLSEFKQVLERDLTEEFLVRVKKHNIFVRENLAKIRAALLDMESDYEKVKDEVNLTIDWENLTAVASKKERIEHRVKGVQMVFTGTNLPDANVVRVDSGYEGKDFFIPFSLITDEIREKYVLESELLYIENVPDFAFYEVFVNGHVMIIEKTDL